MTAHEVYRAAKYYLQWKQGHTLGAFNTYALGHEADILVVDERTMLTTEVEVKVSLSDLKADLKKERWQPQHTKRLPNYFYYAMPIEMQDKAMAVLHQHPLWPKIGLIVVDRSRYVGGPAIVVQKKQLIHDKPAHPRVLVKMLQGWFCKTDPTERPDQSEPTPYDGMR
jgi:hypothetical protein